MRCIAVALFLVLCAASNAAAQERDAHAWIALAREAISAARYDTARMDLDHAAQSAMTPDLERELADARNELMHAQVRAIDATEPRTGWTHGLSIGLLAGAGVAAATSIAFGVPAALYGLGPPRCCDGNTLRLGDYLFAVSVASGVSALAMLAVAAWLASEGRSLEDPPTLIPVASVGADGVWLGVSGLL